MTTVAGKESGTAWESMPTLTVWSYDSPMGAAAGYVRLNELRRRGAVQVEDAVTVTWVPGTHRPRVGHLRVPRHATARLSAASPSGARFSVLGALADLLTQPESEHDPVRALAERLCGTGLDECILAEVRAAVAPGWSALLVLSSGADPSKVGPAIQRGLDRGDVSMTYAVLSDEAPDTMRAAVEEVLLSSPLPPELTGSK